MSAERYQTTDEDDRESAIAAAAITIQGGDLIVLPTDTVYGIGADAFDADAVSLLLAAKGRGREMPPPVLVSSATTLDALAVEVPDWARALVEEFWPGALTVVCKQQQSLQWDLGDTRGTVAIRMPDHELARELLDRTGPLAVSSANLTGQPAALTGDDAERMLGEKVVVIIDDGPSPGGEASTIVDATSEVPRVLRQGAIALQTLQAVLDPLDITILDVDGNPAERGATPAVPVVMEKPAAKETPAKKTTATKKAPAKKAAAKKAPAKKAPAKKTAAKKTSAAKTAAAGAATTAATKAAATKAAAKKTTATKRASSTTRTSAASKAAAAKKAAASTPQPEAPDTSSATESTDESQ